MTDTVPESPLSYVENTGPWKKTLGVDYSKIKVRRNGQDQLLPQTEADALFPPQPVARVLIRKSTVIARVNSIGKIEAVAAEVSGNALQLMQWNAADRPNVYADDPGLLAVLKSAGCADAQVAMVTAPDPTVVP